MTGLINLVSQYSSSLAILPIVSFIMGAISVIIYLINKKRIVKFIPSIITGIISIILAIISISTFTSKSGLNIAWIAIFLGTASLVGIITCYMIELVEDIRAKTEFLNNSVARANARNSERSAKKRKANKVNDKEV
ncbi:hypothetical protein [Anaerococcus tetradius]|uniref:hypothetical protein n=1 Tax=Anaerococcus tetradius TaxID=33036 RepID=UPI0023F29D16|nr:hypothetical protein [Anaerococcus tetradius]